MAKELIEEESLMTLETRQRVTTTETKRKEWTEYEGFCRCCLFAAVLGRLCSVSHVAYIR